MLYMIHACKDREHYIQNYLIPSLIDQGIPNEEIKIWIDEEHKGNLIQCMESFKWCGELKEGATWHLQDKKKYPMPDRDHVMSAIRFFNYVSPSDEKELARNILKRIREYGITDINVGESNRFKKYYKS